MASSSLPNYPSELLWNGRQPDQNFKGTELLYYRVEEFDVQGKISAIDSIRCPNTSFNRSKYSKPEHVLYAQIPKYLHWKVAEIPVRDVPNLLEHPQDRRKFYLRVVHDPIKPPVSPEENYAHSEIRMFLDELQKDKIPSLLSKLFRQTIAELMKPAY